MLPINRPFAVAFALCACVPGIHAQLGGRSVFRVLDIPSSARISALGGSPVAVVDEDINLGLFDPSLLNASMGRQVAFSYLPYFEGIKMGFGSYAHHADSLRTTFSGAVQFVDYGEFIRTEADGTETGSFRGGEYVVQVGASRAIDSLFTIGANLKFITSQLESYTATGWAADVGATFHKPSLGLTVSALVRNIGFVSSRYTGAREKLPFDAQLGVTYRFRHAPFRLGLNIVHLQQWDLTYDDPVQQQRIDPTTGEPIVEEVGFLGNALLHLVPHVEVLLGRNFHLRVGYDLQRRRELKVDGRPGISGLSFGLGLRVSRIHLSYGFAQYHLAGISNTVTLAARFSDFRKRPVGEVPRRKRRQDGAPAPGSTP